MLKYLHIENVAVIESADIEPINGFNVLTGETGTGKSIIIDAINAVLGERTSKEIIRNNSEKAVVSALFGDVSSTCMALLEQNGIEPDENGNIEIRRVLSLNGNGSIRINGRLTSAQTLKEISKYLINIHGQHDNQMLLKPENHYIYLDLIAGNDKERAEYAEAFKCFTDIRRKIKELETDEDKKYDRIDLLKYQIAELENADIKIGEVESLKKARETFRNGEKVLNALSQCLYFLNGDTEVSGAVSAVKNASIIAEKIPSPDISVELTAKLSEALETLETVADTAANRMDDFAIAKADAENADERLDILHRLMLKYGNTEEAMLSYLQSAKEELKKIEFDSEQLELLEQKLVSAEERLISAGDRLTKSRLNAAEVFAKDVCDNLCFMDMQGVKFIVDIQKSRYSKNGCDAVEFLISTNAGESVKPLYKIASGGELSRIMLAIKSLLTDKDDVDTLIFDEIDTGISGRAASKVATQIKKISKRRQVICVTHLAQIAAAAQGHFLIEKNVYDGKTYTKVTLLNGDLRVREIARIMSGTELTDNIISSAKELLDRSNSNEIV